MPAEEPQMWVVDFQMLGLLGLLHASPLPDRVEEVLKEDFGREYLYCRRHRPNAAPVYIFPLLSAFDVSAFAATPAVPPGLVQY